MGSLRKREHLLSTYCLTPVGVRLGLFPLRDLPHSSREIKPAPPLLHPAAPAHKLVESKLGPWDSVQVYYLLRQVANVHIRGCHDLGSMVDCDKPPTPVRCLGVPQVPKVWMEPEV